MFLLCFRSVYLNNFDDKSILLSFVIKPEEAMCILLN